MSTEPEYTEADHDAVERAGGAVLAAVTMLTADEAAPDVTDLFADLGTAEMRVAVYFACRVAAGILIEQCRLFDIDPAEAIQTGAVEFYRSRFPEDGAR